MRCLSLTYMILGVRVVAAATTCPDIELDWGKYSGKTSSNPDVCVYENIRFASPPVGPLRFARPHYPPLNSDPPSPTYPVGCVVPTKLPSRPVPPGGGPVPIPLPPPKPSDLAGDLETDVEVQASTSSCTPTPQSKPQEDCLFLDVYVPASVFEANDHDEIAETDTASLPVIVWFFGGGFITGSKHPLVSPPINFYPGDSIITSTKEEAIWVAGNYRLGAYGWLAGSYMEANAQPNAGLWDQRAVLEFVRDHISKFSGNASRVSVWGESAGASSILHHLIMPANLDEPLFQTAVLQSPAFQWAWNRTGTLDENFHNFAAIVAEAMQCEEADMACLRNATEDVLVAANNEFLNQFNLTGILPVGPAVDDGSTVPDLPTNILNSGDKSKFMQLKSLMVSHTDREIPPSYNASDVSFIPAPIRADPTNETVFENFLEQYFIGHEDIVQQIIDKYPNTSYPYQDTPDTDEVLRAAQIIMDSSFLCNTRELIDTYSSSASVFAMDYAVGVYNKTPWGPVNLAAHATDLLPLFAPPDGDYRTLFDCLVRFKIRYIRKLFSDGISKRLGPGMQSYFMGVALHNDPNSLAVKEAAAETWSPVSFGPCESSSGQCVYNVLQPTLDLILHPKRNVFINNAIIDEQTSSDVCDFWAGIADKLKAKSTGEASSKEQQGGYEVDLEL